MFCFRKVLGRMICAKKLRIFFAVLALFPQVCECWKVDHGFSSLSILTLLLGATGSSSTADLAAMNSPRHSALGGSGGRSEEAIERLDLSSENLALGYHCCLPLLPLDPTGWTTLIPPPFTSHLSLCIQESWRKSGHQSSETRQRALTQRGEPVGRSPTAALNSADWTG